ncbi:unnamed protein product [Cuscuta europaea]|uniref:Uncharacterized protein n=1 Tax=Cuscuta europaea TaxID=41803 RepID=A0A9P1EGK5_CUSEU|nr:unnamed protein product [Cuscuta europaea]
MLKRVILKAKIKINHALYLVLALLPDPHPRHPPKLRKTRAAWLVLALGSLTYVFGYFIEPTGSFKFKDWIILQLSGFILPPIAIPLLCILLYVPFLLLLGFGWDIAPLQLHVRLRAQLFLVCICLVLALCVESYFETLLGFVACFHVLTVINFLAAADDFYVWDVISALLFILFEVGLCYCRYTPDDGYVSVGE